VTPSGRPGRVLVVGGGIAGLATARALYRHGIECDVVERARGWPHPGAGMFVSEPGSSRGQGAHTDVPAPVGVCTAYCRKMPVRGLGLT
jgi:cation diffusion facilitator CzcD-associated flavoprotein CzcO